MLKKLLLTNFYKKYENNESLILELGISFAKLLWR